MERQILLGVGNSRGKAWEAHKRVSRLESGIWARPGHLNILVYRCLCAYSHLTWALTVVGLVHLPPVQGWRSCICPFAAPLSIGWNSIKTVWYLGQVISGGCLEPTPKFFFPYQVQRGIFVDPKLLRKQIHSPVAPNYKWLEELVPKH